MSQTGKVLVQNTNISCVVSKWSASQRGYFPDQYLKYLTEKLQIRSPLINRGYYVRAQAIHQLLKSVLMDIPNQKYQILSLGAGFDTTFFKLKSEGLFTSGSHYFEIDFPKVLSQKLELLLKNEELKHCIGYDIKHDNENIVWSSSSFSLVGGDLYKLTSLERDLVEAGLDHSIPTIFISECVMNYMHPSKSNAILKWAFNKFIRAAFIMYEQICPADGFGYVMKEHFDRIGSPLLSIDMYPTILSQKTRLHQLGWQHVEVQDLNSILKAFDSLEQIRVDKLEPFDEFEELHLKCSHYIIACARKEWTTLETPSTINNNVIDCDMKSDPVQHSLSTERAVWEGTSCASVCRFGHAAVRLNKNQVIMSGGFGKDKGSHKRLGGLKLLNLITNQPEDVICEDPEKLLGERMFHSMVWLSGNKSLLVIGGRMSPAKPLNHPFVIRLKKVGKQCSHQHSSEFSQNDLEKNSHVLKQPNCTFSSLEEKLQDPNKKYDCVKPVRSLECERTENKVDKPKNEMHTCKTPISFNLSDSSNCQNVNCIPSTTDEQQLFLRNDNLEISDWRHHNRECSSDSRTCFNKNDVQCENLEELPADNEDSNIWKVETLTTTGEVPAARWRHSAILLTSPESSGEKKVLVFGGRDHTGRTLSESFLLHVDKSHWTKVPEQKDGPQSRHSHACTLWCGKVLISGGLSETQQALDDIFFFDPKSLSWSQFPVQQNLIPRYSHSAHVNEDVLFLIGGVTTSSIRHGSPGITKVCLKTGLCYNLQLQIPQAIQPVLLFKHASFLDKEDGALSVWVLGGGGNCFSFGTAFNTSLLHLRLH